MRIVGESDGEVEQAEFRECEGHGAKASLIKLGRRAVVGEAEGLFLCGRQFGKAAKQRFDALVWLERNERPAIGTEEIGKRVDDLGDRQPKGRKLKLAADIDRGCSGQITAQRSLPTSTMRWPARRPGRRRARPPHRLAAVRS